MPVTLARLLDDHDRIDAALEALLATAGGAPEPALAARDALDRAISEHVAREKGLVYPEVVREGSAPPSAGSRAYAAEFVALNEGWDAYCAAWPAERVSADPAGHAAAAGAIAALLSDRVRRENECLYPHALRDGKIRLR